MTVTEKLIRSFQQILRDQELKIRLSYTKFCEYSFREYSRILCGETANDRTFITWRVADRNPDFFFSSGKALYFGYYPF